MKRITRCDDGASRNDRLADTLTRAWQTASYFRKDDNGSLIVFSLFVFVLILMAGGMAVDLMRYESTRTNIQNTLDRAILAAADLDQVVDAETVVDDYFLKAGLDLYNPQTIDDTDDLTYSTVTATATAHVQTFFMKNLGIEMLPATVQGKAQERVSEIEISLVLDVSNSMNGSNRLTNMKTAANNFVDTIFDSAEAGTVSVSIVPFNTQVTAGADILSQMNRNNPHAYSSCIDFDDDDFDSVGITLSNYFTQTLHFDPVSEYGSWWGYEFGKVPEWFPCNPSASAEIFPMQSNRTALKTRINALTASGNTSIDIGMKWGSALLDPKFQPVTSYLAGLTGSTISSDHTDRPVAYSDNSTMKVIVAMTDGANTYQYYMPTAYSQGPSGVWNNPSDNHLSVWRKAWWCVDADNNGTDDDGDSCYRDISAGNWKVAPAGGGSAVQYDYRDLFARFTTNYVARLHQWADNSSSSYSWWDSALYKYKGPSAKNSRMADICQAAKDQDIIVFTIGFEVADSDAVYMENCASSESHFFRVAGAELSTAFTEIANKISELRLVQ